jgi:tetratricopeptide (TPR) repeat protein
VTSMESLAKLAWERGCLLVPSANARDLEVQNLNLGSFLFEGDLPPYLDRDLDAVLSQRLGNDGVRFTTLVGQPKSGKTRTLVNLIQQSLPSDTKVFWLKSHPKAIDEFLKLLDSDLPSRPVFVLDDLQKFGPGIPGGFTSQALHKLTDVGVVLATLHEAVLGSAAEGLYDHTASSFSDLDRELLTQIERSTVRFPARLSAQEFQNAVELFQIGENEHVGIEFLAAYFSAGDLHLAQFLALKQGDPLRRATFEAIAFCQAVSSSGFTVEQLYAATMFLMSQSNLNWPWLEAQWLDVVAKITSSDGAGSMHSLLMRSPDDPGIFTVMDYVWTKSFSSEEELLALYEFVVPHSELIGIDPVDAAYSAVIQGLYSWAEEILRYPMGQGWPLSAHPRFASESNETPAEALNLWAYVMHQSGNFEEAVSSYAKLIEFLGKETEVRESTETWHFYLDTWLRLANGLEAQGRLDEAREELSAVLESDPTYAPGYFDLGSLLGEMLRLSSSSASDYSLSDEEFKATTAEREYCFRTALQLNPDEPNYRAELGFHLNRYGNSTGDQDEFAVLLNQAIDSGGLGYEDLEYAHQLLGNYAQELEDFELAKSHYLEAQKFTHDDWPLVPLAYCCMMLNRFEDARAYALEFLEDFKRSLWSHDDYTFNLLLEIETKAGNLDAVDLWKKSRFEAQIAGLRDFHDRNGYDHAGIASSLNRFLELQPGLADVINEYRKRYGIPPGRKTKSSKS